MYILLRKTKNKPQSKRLSSTVIVSVFILLLISSIIIPSIPTKRVYAATPGWDTLSSQAAGWSWVSALGACFNAAADGSYFNPNLTKGGSSLNGKAGMEYDDIGNQIITGYPMFKASNQWGANDKIHIGHVIDDRDNQDGIILCYNVPHDAMLALGYSDISTFLTDMGFTDGGGYWHPPRKSNFSSSVDGDKLNANLWSIAQRKGLSAGPNENAAVKYMFYYYAYISKGACKGAISKTDNIGVQKKIVGPDDSALTDYWLKTTNLGGNTIVLPHTNAASCQSAIDGMVATAGALASGMSASVKELANAAVQRAIDTFSDALDSKICAMGGAAATSCRNQIASAVPKCLTEQGITKDAPDLTYEKVNAVDLGTLAACLESKIPGSLDTILSVLQEAAPDALTTLPSSSSGAASNTDPCEGIPTDTQMRWLVCSLMTASKDIMEMLYSAIQGLLYTPVDTLFSDKFTQVMAIFRNIGMALIVIAGLIMIVAQATGSDLVDAYTVKKVLPKLGFALIGIALIFPLLRVAITFTNDIGLMAGNFLQSISINNGASSQPVDAISGGIGATLFTLFGGFIAFLRMGPAALTLIGGIVLALLIGLFVLALRQLVIVVLVLLAPLAIAASILPGTEKLWKFWKNTLITTLLMFPIIMLFLKSGVFMSSVFGAMEGMDANLKTIMAAVVFFAPYFMLPMAFKMAGGLMSTVFGLVNDRSKGAFDRMRNMRGKATERNMKKMSDGTRFRNRGKWSNRLNTGLQAATNLDKIDMLSGNRRGQMRAWQNTEAQRRAIQSMKENEYFSAFAQDDTMLNAAQAAAAMGNGGAGNINNVMKALEESDKSGTRFKGPEHLAARQQAAALILRAKQDMGSQSFDRAVTLSSPGTGTAFNDKRTGADGKEETFTNYAKALSQINTTYGDDEIGRQTAIANLRSGLSNSGHAVGGVSMGAWIGAANEVRTATQNAATTGGVVSADEYSKVNSILHESVAKELAPGQGAQGKTYAVRENARGAARRLQEFASSAGTQKPVVTGYDTDGSRKEETITQEMLEYEFARAAANLEAIGQTGGEAGDAYARELQGAKVKIGDEELTVREWVTRMDNDPDRYAAYHQRKKSYANAYDKERGGPQTEAPKQDQQPQG